MNRTRTIATTLAAGLIAAGATNGSEWVRLTLVGGN